MQCALDGVLRRIVIDIIGAADGIVFAAIGWRPGFAHLLLLVLVFCTLMLLARLVRYFWLMVCLELISRLGMVLKRTPDLLLRRLVMMVLLQLLLFVMVFVEQLHVPQMDQRILVTGRLCLE